MTEYLFKISSFADNLIGPGFQITNRKVIGYILDNLPFNFHPLTATINSQRSLTFDDVYHFLISGDLMVKTRNAEASSVVVDSSLAFLAPSSRYKGKTY